MRTEIKDILASPTAKINTQVTIAGWVRAFRGNRFIALNDGSCFNNIQVVIDFEKFDEQFLKKINFHSCIKVSGTLVESQGSGQAVELQGEDVEIYGASDPAAYPLQPKRQTMEFLRKNGHFRMRTNTLSSVFRIRHALAFAVHQYFHTRGYYYLHSPIITGNDAEGAGEMFRLTTLDPTKPPLLETGEVDWSKDFFGKSTNLTVSGQLQGEIAALALGKVYTFGPTFRAENSNTPRHLAEFWMIEPEVAFYDINDIMNLGEDFVKYLIKYVMDNYADDLAFLNKRLEDEERNMPKEKRRPAGLIDTLNSIINTDFERLTYTDAIRILKRSKPYKKGKFEFPVEWELGVQAEHERFLVEKEFKKPVILVDYPKEIKAFYMRVNDKTDDTPGETVAAMDLLVPGIGELIGGSQREERYDRLLQKIEEQGIHKEELEWYLDLRKFGGAPHAGFGMGFERMVLLVTGMSNIRDVIPFPRTPGYADF